MKNKTKTQLVLEVMQRDGGITRLIGLNYKVKNLPENIRQLRLSGYDISTVKKVDVKGDSYTRWELLGDYTTVKPKSIASVITAYLSKLKYVGTPSYAH
jgi:hypothetical protein